MARPRGFEPLTYRFVARSGEGSEDTQEHPSTTKDEDSGGTEGQEEGLCWSEYGPGW